MTPFLGFIGLFGFNFAPYGWAKCDGQLIAISQNQALFSLLGTIYGGDGRTTFALPDLRGRVPMHHGNGPGLSNRSIGAKSGQESVTLTVTEMPAHNHTTTVGVSNELGEEDVANGNVIANHTGAFGENAASGQALGGVTCNNTGGGQAHNNMQPYTVVNFCIAMTGIFPSRN